jgi:hypothetical protein
MSKDLGSKYDCMFFMVRIVIGFFSVACVCGGCSWLNKQFNLKDDHPLENLLEKVIESETGIEVDLTPEEGESFYDYEF